MSQDLSPNPLTLAAETRRLRGLPLDDLTVANPADCGFAWPREQLAALLGAPGCERHQPHAFGLSSARRALAAYYAARAAAADPSRICLSASTSEAYTWWFRLLAEPGDNLLVPEPAYPLVSVLADIARVEIRPYRCVLRDGAWAIDASTLRPDARTRALVAISPANPTGHVLGPSDLALLADAARRAAPGCTLLVDEVFLDYPAAGAKPAATALSLPRDPALPLVVLSGLSKVALAPQLKVGWSVVSGPDSWAAPILARLEHHADAFLSVNTPAQVALPGLLDAAPALRAKVVDRLDANAATLATWCAGEGRGCALLPRAAGWTSILRLPPGVDELAFALCAVDEGALVHPGHYYDFAPADGPLAVLSLLPEPARFRSGLGALGRALARL
jgi:aspartate/methionine/tyrosine aminotransferase